MEIRFARCRRSAPTRSRPYFVLSLNNLAKMPSEVGDREAALSAAREAVELDRALSGVVPDVFLLDLFARSL